MKKNNELFNEIQGVDSYFKSILAMRQLPNPDRVLQRSGRQMESFRQLKNDPHVWSCIQSRKAGLLSLDYNINPNGAISSVCKEIDAVLRSLNINKIMSDILEAPLFGYQPMEIVWEETQKQNIYPKVIIAKPQEWFAYTPGGILKIKDSKDGTLADIPEMKVLDVQYESSYLNPYGHSLLSKCYWPVMFKNGGLKFWVNFTERYGMPFLIGQYSRGNSEDEAQLLADSLVNMIQDAVIVTPSDINIELKEATRAGSSNLYAELIKFCNSEISKAILSQTLTTEIDMGSYAAAQTHFKIRREVILSDIRLVESVMNKLIEYIVRLNFKSAVPKFNLVLNDADNTQLIDRDVKIAQTGSIRFSKQYWMDKYGLREEDIEMLNVPN